MNNKTLAWLLAAPLLAPGLALAFTVNPNLVGGSVSKAGYPALWDLGETVKATKSGSGTNTVYKLNVTATTDKAIFNFPGAAYKVGNGATVNITATFNNLGNFLNGTYELKGRTVVGNDGPGGAPPSYLGNSPSSPPPRPSGEPASPTWTNPNFHSLQTLFKANLTGFNANTGEKALGFTTTNFSGWAADTKFTSGSNLESLWLYYCIVPRTAANNYGYYWDTNTTNSAWNSLINALSSHNTSQLNSAFNNKSYSSIDSIATVPVPAAVWLFGSAIMAGLGLTDRRRKSAMA